MKRFGHGKGDGEGFGSFYDYGYGYGDGAGWGDGSGNGVASGPAYNSPYTDHGDGFFNGRGGNSYPYILIQYWS